MGLYMHPFLFYNSLYCRLYHTDINKHNGFVYDYFPYFSIFRNKTKKDIFYIASEKEYNKIKYDFSINDEEV